MRRLLVFLFSVTTATLLAQTSEDFNDGDFSDGNPLTWIVSQTTGKDDFTITNGEVQSDGPSASGDLYFVTNVDIDFANTDVTWAFKLRYEGGAPSGSNKVEFYLLSNVEDISGNAGGYYVRMGESGSEDGIDFFKTSSSTALISDEQDLVGGGIDVHIRITRTSTGNWTLEADANGGDDFTLIGSVEDTEFAKGEYLGLYVDHTSTRRDDFFLDDVTITQNSVADTEPPTIASVSALFANEVEVTFTEAVDEITAETMSNYTIDGLTISEVARNGEDNSKVRLVTSEMANGESYVLVVNGVEDLSGNVIEPNSQETYEYLVFGKAEPFDVVINEFMADPNPVVALPDAEFVELFNRSDKFFDLQDWQLDNQTIESFRFDPGSYLIIVEDDDLELFSEFSNILTIPRLSLNNSSADTITLLSNSGAVIHNISFQGSQGGVSSELINPNGPDYSKKNYSLSVDLSGGTPGEINSIFDDTPDTIPPQIASIDVVSEISLTISFTEPVSKLSAEGLSNYSIDNEIDIVAAERDEDDNAIVRLTVSSLPSGIVNKLTINGVEDLSGNMIETNASIEFEYVRTETAEVGDVLVNEFYAIPSDESSIPNAEFVELLNVSEKFIDLENWTLKDQNGTSSFFGSHLLRPSQYVILVGVNDGFSFQNYGDVLEVSGFRSLNNSGDEITILNENETEIYSIAYSSAISGVTTELINPNGPDFSRHNYGPSVAEKGGTPGSQNSIFDDTPDTVPPGVTSVEVVSATELTLIFTEPIRLAGAQNPLNYSVDAGHEIQVATRDEQDNSIVRLSTSPLTSGQVATLFINGVEDLSGNMIDTNTAINFEYIETEKASYSDVVINEFYAAPSLESQIPSVEFIEIFNNSGKFFQLENWVLADSAEQSNSFSSYLLRPEKFLILTEKDNGQLFESNVDLLEVSNFPSLNNGGDGLFILDGDGELIHQTSYSSSLSGVTSELINPNGPDFSENNYGTSKDERGGTPGQKNSIFDDAPDTTPPTIVSINVLSSTELELTFSEPVKRLQAQEISNYTIGGQVVVNSAMKLADDVVFLSVSSLTSEQIYTLTISNISDLNGNLIAPNSTIDFEYVETLEAVWGDIVINEFLADPIEAPNDFVEIYNSSGKNLNLENWTISDEASTSPGLESFILRRDSFLIIHDKDATIDYSSFGIAVAIPSLTLNNSNDQIGIANAAGERIAFISYTTQTEENVSLELSNPNDPCISISSYSLSEVGSTPGVQNSVFDDAPDVDPPIIVSYHFEEKLSISFSESLNQLSVGNESFSVDGLEVSDVELNDIRNQVDVELSGPLIPGEIYEMTVTGLEDCWGNVMEPAELSFGIGKQPSFNDLIITEIQFDADPSVGLPDVEFIEIYNSTASLLDIGGVVLLDNTSAAILPEQRLSPQQYYVLTTSSGSVAFEKNAIGVSGFPSLSNSGEELSLMLDDELIFSIEYDPDWHDLDKREGGYSLEMKDIQNPCVENFNWGSSVNSIGGTPGADNSLIESVPDSFGPRVVEVVAVASDTLKVLFDERLDPESSSYAEISFAPSLDIDAIIFLPSEPKEIMVTLTQDLIPSQEHEVVISGVFDCNGNEVQDQPVNFAFPSVAEKGDVVLSEVLFNPRPGEVDFVELYNKSEKYLSLKDWQIARLNEEGIADQKEFSSQELIISPFEFQVLTTDTDILQDSYPNGMAESFHEVHSLPTFANDTGNVVLLNSQGEIQELFHYEEDYHYQLLESTDGVSLERISYSADVNDPNNWRSAASTEGFATPGYQNSQSILQSASTGKLQASPKVFVPGNSGLGRDFTTINYEFDQPGKFANISIYDQRGRLIKKMAEGALLSTTGFLRWDGTTDSGELARLGYYLVLFEVFDTNGASETLKETVVVGRDF